MLLPIYRLVGGLLLTCCVTAHADWPQFRGPQGQGISDEKGLPITWSADENVAWKVELPGAGGSEPIIVGDRIFLPCYSGFGVYGESGGSIDDLRRQLICLSTANGKILWAKDIPTKQPEQASIREGHGYASNTPVADDKRVYAFFGKSGVFAFDHAGNQLWQADVGEELNGWGSAASPILYRDLVIVNASVESQSLVALDKNTGKEVWRADRIRESWNTPLLTDAPSGSKELIVAIQGKVLAFEPNTGEPLWNCNTDITWYMVPSVAAAEGIIYCMGGRSGVAALAVKAGGRGNVTETHRLWTGRKGSNVSSPIFHEGHMYWMNDNLGIAYCADGKTGEILYEERVARAGQVYASPLLAEGRLYYVNRTGRTYVIAAKPRFEQLAVNTLEERGMFNSGLIASGGRLYLRSNRYLYCLAKQ
jgi:outer membrane protein assembly factor BamB